MAHRQQLGQNNGEQGGHQLGEPEGQNPSYQPKRQVAVPREAQPTPPLFSRCTPIQAELLGCGRRQVEI